MGRESYFIIYLKKKKKQITIFFFFFFLSSSFFFFFLSTFFFSFVFFVVPFFFLLHPKYSPDSSLFLGLISALLSSAPKVQPLIVSYFLHQKFRLVSCMKSYFSFCGSIFIYLHPAVACCRVAFVVTLKCEIINQVSIAFLKIPIH